MSADEYIVFGNEVYDTEIAIENASHKLLQAIKRVVREERENIVSIEAIANKILKHTDYEIKKKDKNNGGL